MRLAAQPRNYLESFLVGEPYHTGERQSRDLLD